MTQHKALDFCFWCDEPKTTPPIDAVYVKVMRNYVPCDACQDEFNTGILCMEVDMADKLGQPAMFNGLAPTGNYAIVKREDLPAIIEDERTCRQTLEAGKLMLEPAAFNLLIGGKPVNDN